MSIDNVSTQVTAGFGERLRYRFRAGDPIGLTLSVICVLHCLALPMTVSVLPTLNMFVEHGVLLHIVLFALVVPVAGIAMVEGWYRHRLIGPAIFAGVGIVCLGTAILMHDSEISDTAFSVAGSLCLATAHIVSWSRASVAAKSR